VLAQRPPEQDELATWLVLHARPHAPQLSTSASMCVSQPSSGSGAAGCEQFL